MEGFEKNVEKDLDSRFRDGAYSKAVRAGKRTYFLDVKSTRKDEYYLTITESKKRFDNNGQRSFEKHKIFLYQEDFEKFIDGLEEVINFIKENQLTEISSEEDFIMELGIEEKGEEKENYTKIDFEDLSK